MIFQEFIVQGLELLKTYFRVMINIGREKAQKDRAEDNG